MHFKALYKKILGIDDTPHKIAGGVAVGMFFGLLPGLGPVTAALMAAIFRLNTAAAFASGFLANTWIGFLTGILAVKIGAAILGLDWQETWDQMKGIFENFHIKNFFEAGVLKLFWPLLVGYAVIGLVLGVISYMIAFWVVTKRRERLHK